MTAVQTPTPALVPAHEFRFIALADLRESALNPRKHFDPVKLEELAASIRAKGVLTPLLVRPVAKGAAYEIAAGHRRYRAAKLAGVDVVPAVVQEMSEVSFLEVLVTENNQREDVHPLEEAQGYQTLIAKAGYSVEKIAERQGRSIKYVYDRVKLLQLTREAQSRFLDGQMTAGHAILLARLKPEDQHRAMKEHGALFTDERPLFTPEEEDKLTADDEPMKPRSVREFAGWIDEHVKLEAAQADPMLFPELVETVKAATEETEKIVRITHHEMTPEEARDGEKIILGRSWERADGKHHSKACDHAVTGVVVIGPGRGEAFKVCVAKEKCLVHWGDRIRARKKQQAAAAKGGSAQTKEQERYKREEEKRKREAADHEALKARFRKAAPAIATAFAERIRKAPAGAAGLLGRFLTEEILGHRGVRAQDAAAKHFTPGRTAEDLVRYLVFLNIFGDIADEWAGPREIPDRAKTFGIDLQKILDEVAPAEKAAVVARCRDCNDTEGGEGVSWAEQPNPKTGLGLCTRCRAKRKAKNPKVKGAPRARATA